MFFLIDMMGGTIQVRSVLGSSSTLVKVLAELVGDEPTVINEFLEFFRVGTAKIAEDLRGAAKTGEILAVGNVVNWSLVSC